MYDTWVDPYVGDPYDLNQYGMNSPGLEPPHPLPVSIPDVGVCACGELLCTTEERMEHRCYRCKTLDLPT